MTEGAKAPSENILKLLYVVLMILFTKHSVFTAFLNRVWWLPMDSCKSTHSSSVKPRRSWVAYILTSRAMAMAI